MIERLTMQHRGDLGLYHVNAEQGETRGEFEHRADAVLFAASPKLAEFARSYLAMVANVTAKGTKAKPTVAQLNVLFEQARAALAGLTP